MLTIKRILCSKTAIAVLGIGEGAIAQNLIDLGEDANGKPAFMVQESPNGTSFKMLQSYGGGMIQTLLSGGCAENKLFIVSSEIYNEQGILVSHQFIQRNVVPAPGSVSAKGLSIVCRNIGAAGW
jgi:hypothetical protein